MDVGVVEGCERFAWEPVGFLPASKVVPCSYDQGDTPYLRRFAYQVSDGGTLFLRKEVETVEEDRSTSGAGHVYQEVMSGAFETEHSLHLCPASGRCAARTEDDDRGLGRQLFGEVLQKRRLADSGITAYFYVSALVQRCVDCRHSSGAYQCDTADTVFDVIKCVTRGFGKRSACIPVSSATGQPKRSLS